MDRALDEIVAERYRGNRFQERRIDRRLERNSYPRDRIRKSTRNDSRNIDSYVRVMSISQALQLITLREWVHDKFDDHTGRRSVRINQRYSPSPDRERPSAKLRVENLHYDLTEDDLDDLFNRIGPVLDLSLIYDRAGRSEGIAYVTYEYSHHAKRAIQEFDGANAKGQPIRLISIPSGPSSHRGLAPRSRSLFDRVTSTGRKPRSYSGFAQHEIDSQSLNSIDRYVPVHQNRSHSPRNRNGIRRIRERINSNRARERLSRDGRPKKTQEELDAEMEEYWNNKNEINMVVDVSAQNSVPMDVEMKD